MYKTFAIIAFAAIGLSACSPGGINSNCTALGAVGGAALGSLTDNNLAQSAIAGGVAGAIAADQGYCR